MNRLMAVCIISLLIFTACVPKSDYRLTEQKETISLQKFTIELPSGWRINQNAERSLSMTKDGLGLQKIMISSMPVTDPLSNTKKKFAKGMLPQEAADIIVGNIISNPHIKNAEILKNEPEKIGGLPAFKLITTFSQESGLKKKSVLYGVIIDEAYYEIYYDAPERYYFEKDFPTFEAVKSSIVVK